MVTVLEQVKQTPPVIVVGMHRSGTSILTRNLSDLGLAVGRDISGNVESRYFQTLNREIMSESGGRWDNVKPVVDKMGSTEFVHQKAAELEKKLFRDGELARFFRLGEKLSMRLGIKQCNWGWKDPRNSVTLPVWLTVFPGARVIHVIRNGIDVAVSLHRREKGRRDTDPDLARGCRDIKYCLKLWEDYIRAYRTNMKLYTNVACIELRYEELLRSPKPQFETILEYINMKTSESKLDKVCSSINSGRLDNNKYRSSYTDEIPELQLNPLMKELGYS